MAHIIRVYFENKIYSIDLSNQSQASIGSGNDDSLRLDAHGLSENHVRFSNINGTWIIKGKKNLCRENSRISSENLFGGVTYSLQTTPQIFIAIHPKQEDSNKIVNLNSNHDVKIGRAQGNDIIFANMRTSSNHCQIYKVGEGYKIKDCGSKNGTFVNGKRITEKILCNGDIVNISIYQLIFENNQLSFLNVGNDVIFNIPTEEKGTSDNIYDDSNDYEGGRSNTYSLFGDEDSESKNKKGTVSVFDF